MSAIKHVPLSVIHQLTTQREVPGRRTGLPPRGLRRVDRGQSTVEYALLVVGIATLALLVLAWASSTDVVGALFDRVFRWVTGRVG
jgi:hypothetical protein